MKLFRKSDDNKYKENDLWYLPLRCLAQGRYNFIGQQVLYCCTSKEGIPYEVNPIQNDIVDIGEFVLKRDMFGVNINKFFLG